MPYLQLTQPQGQTPTSTPTHENFISVSVALTHSHTLIHTHILSQGNAYIQSIRRHGKTLTQLQTHTQHSSLHTTDMKSLLSSISSRIKHVMPKCN